MTPPLGVDKFIPLIREQVESHLKPNQSNLLMGLSLGGMCTLEWIKQFPQDFKGAVVMNTSLADLSFPWKRIRLGLLPKMGKAHLKGGEYAERTFVEITSNYLEGYDENTKMALKIQRERPMRFSSVVMQLLSGALYQLKINHSPTPLLVLACPYDKLVNVDCSKKLSSRLKSEVRLHPWAGHELPMDDAPWVAREVTDWWSKL